MHMVAYACIAATGQMYGECLLVQSFKEPAFNDSSSCCCRYHANRMLSFYAPGSVFSLLPQKIFLHVICGRDPGCVEENHCVTS
jgi:hypothetical protein